MAFDIGGSALQFFLDILYLIILYISKIGIIIGLMLITERLCKAAIERNWRYHLNRILKGLGLVVLSLVVYLVLV
jgi:hypothetical protein